MIYTPMGGSPTISVMVYAQFVDSLLEQKTTYGKWEVVVFITSCVFW